MTDEHDGAVGYKRPPASTRFRKGTSGNPKGRPRGRSGGLPYDTVLGRKVTIREDGRERSVTAAEAFLLHLTKQGLEGDAAAAGAAIAAFETARAAGIGVEDERLVIGLGCESYGSVITALEPLRMGEKLDRYRLTARVVLEPWIVEAALDRLGDRRLTADEQEVVYKVTRMPRRVRWPTWWVIGKGPAET